MRENIIRFVIAIILAGILDEFIHTHVGIPAPSYNMFIDTMAYVTKPLEALGVAIIYYLLGDRLPGQSQLLKGVVMGLLLLLAEGQLIRQPFMNLLFSSNTLKDILLRQSQVWLSHLTMTVIIALIIKPKYSSDK